MNYDDFLDNISSCSKEDVFHFIPDMKEEFYELGPSYYDRYIDEILKIIDLHEFLYEWFKAEEQFKFWSDKLDIPSELHFGVEIEVGHLELDTIRKLFESNAIITIMRTLKVPDEIANKIILNADFEKTNEPNKWVFFKEGFSFAHETEASSPILKNELEDLNQIVAMCTLFKSLHSVTQNSTGLHINIDASYLECNEKAVENLLKIWAECEELLFKISNQENEKIRFSASTYALPIKANIQDFFENDGSITLNSEEDMERFLYQIQAKDRLDNIVVFPQHGGEYNFIYNDLENSTTDEERFQVFHNYSKAINELNEKSRVRHTSINFNHMRWNSSSPGRIEIRIFNSSLEPRVIFENLLLVGKIFEVSLKNAKDPTYKKNEFEQLFLHNISETTKLNYLMDLLFDDEMQKRIFINRFNSIQKKLSFHDEFIISGKDTFIREDKDKRL